ncbi:MAG: nucleotide exchange factor GrpE [Chloroflexi bacterium]|nr:nucleotide exchange factor GrpE [Chloroflexota bacterium]
MEAEEETQERTGTGEGSESGADQSPGPDTGAGPGESGKPDDGEDTVRSLRDELAAVMAEKEQQLSAWQRTQADFANFRRRTEQERVDLVRTAEASLIRELLPVLDDLERALAGLPPELRDLNWVEGIVFIERKLRAVLDLHGLQPIEALGKEFDPYEHEAIVREGEPGEATVVTGELQRGYRLHDRVLRPTLVKVGHPTNKKSE